jgi:hypothetical protein
MRASGATAATAVKVLRMRFMGALWPGLSRST